MTGPWQLGWDWRTQEQLRQRRDRLCQRIHRVQQLLDAPVLPPCELTRMQLEGVRRYLVTLLGRTVVQLCQSIDKGRRN